MNPQEQAFDWESMYPREAEWLRNYSGPNHFFLSLQAQYLRFGKLTDRQTEFVTTAWQREKMVASPSLKTGDGIEIKAWLARAIAEEFQTIPVEGDKPVAFRNLDIVAFHRETEKALYLTVRYSSKICQRCHVCGKELDTEVSRACGIGPVCAKRLGFKRAGVEDAQAIVAKMEEISEDIGDIGPRWIPKSQVVSTWKAGDK